MNFEVQTIITTREVQYKQFIVYQTVLSVCF